MGPFILRCFVFFLDHQRWPVLGALAIAHRLATRILVKGVQGHAGIIDPLAILLHGMVGQRHPRERQRSEKGHPAQRMSCHWIHHCFGGKWVRVAIKAALCSLVQSWNVARTANTLSHSCNNSVI
ncbi:hypothetical protein D9M71_726980 [compost metagenome]